MLFFIGKLHIIHGVDLILKVEIESSMKTFYSCGVQFLLEKV